MRIVTILAAITASLVFASCVDTGSVLPNVTGKSGEVLLIIDDPLWGNEIGDSVFNYFSQEVAGIPWDEPFYDVSRANHAGFLNILLTARNIIDIDVSPRYTKVTVKYFRDLYSDSQTYVKIHAPNAQGVLEALGTDGEKILRFFYVAERKRTLEQYRRYNNIKAVEQVFDSSGVEMMIPTSYNRAKYRENFIWLMAGKSKAVQQNILIYWYDYKSVDDFKVENLVAKRDSILKVNLPGPSEGSFVKTVMFYPPVLKEFNLNKEYVAELRGIWEMDGDMMGGPFVSHSRVDKRSNRIVCVEGFLYAPDKNKRNYLRQIEAMIYTVQFPKELKVDVSKAAAEN